MIAKETGWYAPELLIDSSALPVDAARTTVGIPDGTSVLEAMVLNGIVRVAQESDAPETASIEAVPPARHRASRRSGPARA